MKPLKRIFRPVYGEMVEARPKRWWHPKDRKTARLAASVADFELRSRGIIPRRWASAAEIAGLRNIVETTEQGDYMPKYLPPGLFGED